LQKLGNWINLTSREEGQYMCRSVVSTERFAYMDSSSSIDDSLTFRMCAILNAGFVIVIAHYLIIAYVLIIS